MMDKKQSQELDWQGAEDYLKRTEKAYQDLVGMPGVNPFFALGIVAEVRARFDKGERTQELYDRIWELT